LLCFQAKQFFRIPPGYSLQGVIRQMQLKDETGMPEK
jgi:hypothetical protein